MPPRDASGTKEDAELCQLLRKRVQQGSASECLSPRCIMQGFCECAIDVAPDVLLRKPWELLAASGARKLCQGRLLTMQLLTPAATEEGAQTARTWRCFFVTVPSEGNKCGAATHSLSLCAAWSQGNDVSRASLAVPFAVTRTRQTQSGRWRETPPSVKLTKPPGCAGFERTKRVQV
jgi:hypothetical protein